ncbi:hypothetical protein Droror1_Dr00024607 [Drosera rotundifolia]
MAVRWDPELAVSTLEKEFVEDEEKVRRAFRFPVKHGKSMDLEVDDVQEEIEYWRCGCWVLSRSMGAKPQFALKCNKLDIPGWRNRAYAVYVAPSLRSEEFVEDLDFLIRRVERFLGAGADTIIIDAELRNEGGQRLSVFLGGTWHRTIVSKLVSHLLIKSRCW